MNSKMKLILLILSLLVVLIIFFFYYVLKDKKQNVNDKLPYSEIIGKELISVNDAALINNGTSRFKDYEKEITNIESIDTTNVQYILLPKGSTYNFNNTVHYKNSTSGITSAYLLGEVRLKNSSKKYKIVYNFGYLKTLCIDEPCNYWEYKKAPWQEQKLNTKYFE